MQIIIVEDEKPAAQKLKKAVEQYNNGIEVVAILGSIREAISWLAKNEHPQLAFMDISLGDGLSFKIFEQVNINFPVIFTTAYDEYWQEAFEHNSIDYLLKPVKQEKLEAALKKFETLKKHFTQQFQQLQAWQQNTGSAYKKRFLVKRGSDYISVKTDDIALPIACCRLLTLASSPSSGNLTAFTETERIFTCEPFSSASAVNHIMPKTGSSLPFSRTEIAAFA